VAPFVFTFALFFLATNDTVIHCFALFFFLSSAEKKKSGTVLKQPHHGTVYLHFFLEQYLPICNSFPPLQPLLLAFLLFPRPCVLTPAWSVQVPPIFTPGLQLQGKQF
jgi:hypothetical protein